MEENTPQPDWSISELYEKSWEVVKKNKVLWLFGMAIAGAASGFNSFSNSSSNLNGILKPSTNPSASPAPDQISQVLGAATSAFPADILNFFSLVPWYFYAILILEVIFLVVLGYVTGIIYSSWSHAGLIQGILAALNNEKPTIAGSSEKAFPSIKSLVFLNIVPGLAVVGVGVVVSFIFILLFSLGDIVFKIIVGILFAVWVIFFLYALIMLSLTQIWSFREVIIGQKSAMDSLKKGYFLAKKKLGSMFLLGLVNTILTGILTGIPILLVIGVFTGGILSLRSNQDLGVTLIILGIILIVTVLIGLTFLGGILNAFKASVWTIAYQKIAKKYEQ